MHRKREVIQGSDSAQGRRVRGQPQFKLEQISSPNHPSPRDKILAIFRQKSSPNLDFWAKFTFLQHFRAELVKSKKKYVVYELFIFYIFLL